MRRLLGVAGAVAALTYFFDANSGAGRRAMLRDRTLAFFRGRARKGERAGRAVAAEAYGVTQKVQHLKEEDKGPVDDVTLARKVETEIFRGEDVPKGQINVNAEHGVVYLRGEVDSPDMIRDLEEQTRKVQGVSEVRNLLHTPGTPAPTA
jgi:osmotically-inducible protein OsmY